MIAVFKILTSKENASDEAFSLLVLYQLGSWTGVRTNLRIESANLRLYQLGSWTGVRTCSR